MKTMSVRDEEVLALISQQAVDWFVAHRDGRLDAREREAFGEWLLASPAHVEEYLEVAVIARALPTAADDPEYPLDAILARADAATESNVRPLSVDDSAPLAGTVRTGGMNLWRLAVAAVLAVVIGGFLWWSTERPAPQHYATPHGEQHTWRLADNSLLHLNTNTAITVRYSRNERLVEIDRGQALFVVTHDPRRPFRVVAGATDVVAVGTQFDVYRQADLTVVTVVEGQVSVGSGGTRNPRLEVNAGEQVRVSSGILPPVAARVDAQRSTAWLNRRIAFDHETLATVAAEFNRYVAVPIEIESPSLRTLVVSGVFAADDTETFLSYLRSLDGVTVETTSSRIRVFRPAATPQEPRKTR
jgi:transmembrane sensor